MDKVEFAEEQDSVDVLKKKKELYSQNLKSRSFTWWGWTLSVIIGAIAAYSFINISTRSISEEKIIPYVFAGGLSGAFLYGYILFALRIGVVSRLRRIELELVKLGS